MSDVLRVSTASGALDGIWQAEKGGKRVVVCTPCLVKPHPAYLASLEAEVPLLQAAGWDDSAVWHVGCPYISAARSLMLRQALDAKADVVVFIDYDVSWAPGALLRLIETEGDVVAGTYRYKRPEEEYMGRLFPGIGGTPIVRADGALKAFCVPAGFLKITRAAVARFIEAYPGLTYGDKCSPHIDLFQHGAHKGIWYGEDYAFSRNWLDAGGDIWIVPDLELHHNAAGECYRGNFHQFLLRQPGGSDDPARTA
jgi:hypothetical protein